MVSSCVQSPAGTFSLSEQLSFGIEAHSDLCQTLVVEHSGLYLTWVMAVSRWLVHGQT
jgi:hypothetical protein